MSALMAEWLLSRFAENRRRIFVVWKDQRFSYEWLLDDILRLRKTLDQSGIRGGTTVSLEGDYSPRTIALLIALIERGAIIVPLTAAAATKRDEFRHIAEVQVAITLTDDDGVDIACSGSGEPQNDLLCKLAKTAEPGLVLFSSGSTGNSKAALHNMLLLLNKFRTQRQSMVTLAFLMLDHIGGMNTLFYVLSNVGTLVCVDSRDPETVCAAVERHGVELLPTSPTFLNLLLISEAYKRHSLSSLKRITYGTEVMPQQTLDRIHWLFPDVQLQQTYGLSETGILRSKSCSPDSLWVKVGGEDFETKIHDGTLWIRARSAMLGYLNAPSPFDSEGWFNTGDAVESNGEFIRVLGRTSEIINVGGQKVYPAEIENLLLQIPNVNDVAVRGERNPITGQMVVARFNLLEPEDPAAFRKRVRDYCRGALPAFKTPARIEIVATDQYNARYKKVRRLDNAATSG